MKKDNTSQVKEFGIALGIILVVIGLLPLIRKHPVRVWAIYAGLAVFIARFFAPRVLSPVYAIFLKVTHIIGRINSAILLTIVYYFIVTPIGFVMRFFKNKVFTKNIDKSLETYWIRKETNFDNPEEMKRQF